MNGSAKRLMAVMLATVMIASAMVVVLVDEQDSSAEADTDYYYNQLDMDFTKSVYNAVATIPNFESLTITIDSISAADKATMTAN